jgi:hypothetical protein
MGRAVEHPVAALEQDAVDALDIGHLAADVDPHRVDRVEDPHEVLVEAVVGGVLVHPEFLLDDELLLGDVGLVEIGVADEAHQEVEVLLEVPAAGEVIGRGAVVGEGVRGGAGAAELHQDVLAPRLLEELVLEEMGDPGGGLEAVASRGGEGQIDGPVTRGEDPDLLGEARLGQDVHRKAAREDGGDDLFAEDRAAARARIHRGRFDDSPAPPKPQIISPIHRIIRRRATSVAPLPSRSRR